MIATASETNDACAVIGLSGLGSLTAGCHSTRRIGILDRQRPWARSPRATACCHRSGSLRYPICWTLPVLASTAISVAPPLSDATGT